MSSSRPFQFAALAAGAASILIAAACGGPKQAQGEGGSPVEPPAAVGQAGAPQKPAAPDLKLPTAPDPEKVVATVNGQPIKAGKVYQVYASNKLQYQASGQPLSDKDDAEIKRQSLTALIVDELFFQAAQAANIKPTEKDLADEMQTVRSRFGTEENFQKYLQQAGQTEEEAKKELGRRLAAQMYMQSVASTAKVQEAEAKGFYDANKDMFVEPEQVRAQVIVINTTPTDPELKQADAKKRAEEAHRRAVAGEDFGALAKEYSQVPNASKGGDMGYFPKGKMFPKFDEVAFSTEPGKVSDVFETPTGLNILKIADKKAVRNLSFDEVKPQLMLDMSRLKERDAVTRKINELRLAGKVEILDPEFQPAPEAPAAAPAKPAKPAN